MENAHGHMPSAFEGLPRVMAERLWEGATLVAATGGKTLVALGSRSTSVYLVIEGRVQVTLVSLGGREVILRDLGKGDLFGELAAVDGQPRSASIVALTDCQLASIPAETFAAATSELPEGAAWLARRLTAQVRDLTERVFELNALRVRSRLHRELLRLCGPVDEESGPVTLDPTPTHAGLASRVGTHREGVTRELGLLAEQGIVRQVRRRLTVTDVKALIRLVRIATGERPS